MILSWLWSAIRAGRQLAGWLRISGLAAWRAVVGFIEHDDLTLASSISYYGLLSLFPFLMLAFAVLGSVTADEADRAAVLQFVLQYLPERSELVTGQLDALRQASLGLGTAGTALLAWPALGLFRSVTSAVNHAWRVEQPGGYLQHHLMAFLMLMAAGVLLVVALLLVSAIRVVQASWFATVLDQMPGLEILTGLAFGYAATLLPVMVVGWIFYFVPNTDVRLVDVWVGALLTGWLWRLAFDGFSWYVTGPSWFSIPGSVAAIVVFLFWVQLEASILLYGAEFTAAYARLRRDAAG